MARCSTGVTAKDIILALIAQIGIGGGTGSVLRISSGRPFARSTMEERMTVCNMSIEGGARAGMIAPDDTTFNTCTAVAFAPKGADWDAAVARWKQLADRRRRDVRPRRSRSTRIALEPMITYGTNPGMGMPITGLAARTFRSGRSAGARFHLRRPCATWISKAASRCWDIRSNVVFIGSCTNSRISDLRAAASLLKGRKVNPNVRVMVVPGSQQVKRQAEAEGLPEIFRAAGCDYREPGCSMCIAMNGDQLQPGEYSVSTSNRNFEGRQGKGGRTFLASPLTAAASALTGVVTDVRTIVMKPSLNFRKPSGAAADQQHRYRPDHPGALPEDDFERRPRQAALLRLAL